MDVFKKTAEFNSTILGIQKPPFPTRLPAARKDWAKSALIEEVMEFVAADNLADEADALIDLIYFAAGRAHEMGFSGRAVFGEVHRANMLKVRGELSKRPNSLGFDAIKPEGWTPPDIKANLDGPARPKLLIVGHGRHGKDTVCEMLQDMYDLRFTSSSMFCAEHILLPHFNVTSHLPSYPSVEECYADRHGRTKVEGEGRHLEHREVWYDQIAAYCSKDGSRLAREILEHNDVYCGMRSPSELVQCIKDDVFDCIAWVDRSKEIGPEPQGSMGITRQMADYVIDNNGDLDQLAGGVHAFMDFVDSRA